MLKFELNPCVDDHYVIHHSGSHADTRLFPIAAVLTYGGVR